MRFFLILTSIRFSAKYTMKRSQMTLLAVVAFLAIAFLVLVSKTAMPTLKQRVEHDRARDVARFTPENSVDIAMAMKLVTHAPPNMLSPPTPSPPTLLFPPSQQDLERLSGPAVTL
jgi:hypothetical protein